VASEKDITQGLPRVEELFEARKPKREAILAEISGEIAISEAKKKHEILIKSDDGTVKSYPITYGSRLKVKEGDRVTAGDELTEGQINPHDLLRILGVKAVQEHLLKEVLMVYRLQGVGIGDKHIEVIVHQMLRKVRVEDAGDTGLLPGSMVDIFLFEKENEKTIEEGGRPAVAKRILLGITKAALATDSFLSAASFQETTRVLTEAAIKGKEDPLVGLKENVIIGKLIPAGTGLRRYNDIEVEEVNPTYVSTAESIIGQLRPAEEDILDEAESEDEFVPEEEADDLVTEEESEPIDDESANAEETDDGEETDKDGDAE